jgi:hypothetical protein
MERIFVKAVPGFTIGQIAEVSDWVAASLRDNHGVRDLDAVSVPLEAASDVGAKLVVALGSLEAARRHVTGLRASSPAKDAVKETARSAPQ